MANTKEAFNHLSVPVETRSSVESSHNSVNQASSIKAKYNEKVSKLKRDYEHLRMKSDSL